MNTTDAQTFNVGTLNIRNTADRWPERSALLIEQLIDLRPDIIGLQEIRWPSRQAWMLTRGANRLAGPDAAPYRLVRAQKSGWRRFWEGLGILTNLPVLESGRLDLRSGNRVAQRALVRLTPDIVLDFYNTHLDHATGNDDLRLDQAQRILDWMTPRNHLPQILVGDLNSQPDDPALRAISATLRSAYSDVHGREPDLTVPTPLSARFGDDGSVIDFIFVNSRVRVHDARVTFDRPHPDDDRLVPSDHYGIAATISIVS